jgi:hypothetical protein
MTQLDKKMYIYAEIKEEKARAPPKQAKDHLFLAMVSKELSLLINKILEIKKP